MSQPITILHLTTPLDEPICPKCGQGHEDDGGTVSRHGNDNDGPYYWECDTCEEAGEYGPVPVQWGHV
jgi:hypothetical protein